MSRTDSNSLEHVLLLIAAMDPRPWYPRVYARDYNVSLDDLNDSLLVLWNEGLLVRADEGSASTGAGLILSLAGKRLLDNPTGLQRLNAVRPRRSSARGQSVVRDDGEDRDLPEALPAGRSAQQVRAALSRPVKPVVTRVLIFLNLGVFLIGLALAAQSGDSNAASSFFMGSMFSGSSSPGADAAWKDTGSVTYPELLAGQWWRLLSSCFVHFGFLHIGMNMYVLFSAGRNGEQVWGWWRFLVIYLLSGLGGSVLAMYHEAVLFHPGHVPIRLAGASGAICGIMAGELVWVLLNGRHLPKDMASGWLRTLIINAVMISVFSFMQGVSWQGHLGGAIVGALVAFILNVQRFAAAPWRWVVLVLLLLLPAGGWLLVDKVQAQRKLLGISAEGKVPLTEAQEGKEIQDLLRPIRLAREKADSVMDKKAGPLLKLRPERRVPKEKVDSAIAELEQSRAELQKLADDLDNKGPYKLRKVAEKVRTTGGEYLHAYAAFLQEAINCLRKGIDPRFVPEYDKREKRVAELYEQWDNLFN